MDDRNQRIREIAYRLWEQEGWPESQADRHWTAAVAIVEEQDTEAGNSSSETMTEDWKGAASKSPAPAPPPLAEPSERRRSAA